MIFCKKLGVPSAFIFPLFILPLLFCTSCRSAKDKYIEELTTFTEQVCAPNQDFSPEEWSIVFEQYQAFRDEGKTYRNEFTTADRMRVDSCYRKLNVSIAGGCIRSGAEQINGYLEEAINLFEDLLQ